MPIKAFWMPDADAEVLRRTASRLTDHHGRKVSASALIREAIRARQTKWDHELKTCWKEEQEKKEE